MTDVLRVEDLALTLRDGERRFTLDVPGLAVAPGEALGLTGPSGTGKTLLLELLGLLRRADRGSYRLGTEGTQVQALWAGRGGRERVSGMRGTFFGFVPQTGGLMPFLTVRENVALTQRVSGRRDGALIGALLERLDLGAVAGLRPDRLSIGQRQRVAIARALAHRPRFVIADEPTAALDPDNAAAAMALLVEAAAGEGTAVLVSSHDIALLDRFALTRYRLNARAEGAGVASRLERATSV